MEGKGKDIKPHWFLVWLDKGEPSVGISVEDFLQGFNVGSWAKVQAKIVFATCVHYLLMEENRRDIPARLFLFPSLSSTTSFNVNLFQRWGGNDNVLILRACPKMLLLFCSDSSSHHEFENGIAFRNWNELFCSFLKDCDEKFWKVLFKIY